MSAQHNITFVIASLALGGAQRAISNLSSGLATRGHSVAIITFDPRNDRPFFPLHPDVKVVPLDLGASSSSLFEAMVINFRRVRRLREVLVSLRPEVIVSFMGATNVLSVLAGKSLLLPVLVCERTDPSQCKDTPVWEFLRRVVYPFADAVVVQTNTVFAKLPWPLRRKAHVLPNPVLPVQDAVVAERPRGVPPTEPSIIAMGRLSEEKGFDLLLKAFALNAPVFPGWRLTILGDGPCRDRLLRLARELGVNACLPGTVSHPAQHLACAKIFALPSRFEGFPNALCEALASGLPSVAFDCPSGPAEILRDGVDGMLVPPGDVVALAAALARLMGDEALRQAMAARAPEVLDRFGAEKVLDLWEQMLTSLRIRKKSRQGAMAVERGMPARLGTVLASLRLSIDSSWLLRCISGQSLNFQDWAGRFLRFTPELLENTLRCNAPEQLLGDWFSLAVSYFRFGVIYKLTGRDRTNLADSEVLRLAREFPRPRLLEVGVSDGSSALGLLRSGEAFAEVILTDRYNVFYRKAGLFWKLFYDSDRNLKLLKLFGLSFDLSELGRVGKKGLVRIETANPVLRREFSNNAIQRFDLFSEVWASPVEFIKCANLLNRSYFSDQQIRQGADNLARSLCEGGYIVVSQNNERYGDGEAVFILRKTGGTLELVKSVNDHDAARLFQASGN